MKKNATVSHVIHPLLAERWSPRAFSDRNVEPQALRSLLEAARWAPSCFNAQPWRFVVAMRQQPEAFERMVSCLNPTNQRWASKAGVLVIAVAQTHFAHNKTRNRHAWHDVGLAVAQLTVQATSLGLAVHQMAGIDGDRARDVLRIPKGFEPVTGIAVGYADEPDGLPEDLKQRERAPRARLSQSDLVYSGVWNEPLSFVQEDAVERVLLFWFGEPNEEGLASDHHAKRWWMKDRDFDEQIRDKFALDHQAIVQGRRQGWVHSTRGRLAYLIVLDQFSRNMFRDEPGMFANDARALAIANEGIDLGMDRALAGDMRAFFYLPLMHSEALEDQQRCVALFESFVNESEGKVSDRLAHNLQFAIAHRDIIAKFGRFPHRNAVLGRKSTPEEEAFLNQPGSSF